jgi:arylsulfatase A-like enzyme
VDDGVERIVRALKRIDQLDDTYIFFISDNGYMLGEHRVPDGKGTPYEEAIHQPFVVRGPGVSRGGTSGELASNVDLAATVAQIAHVQPPYEGDGVSLLPLIRGGTAVRDSLLLESFSSLTGQPKFQGVRTKRRLYVRYSEGGRELYDLKLDPLEVSNLAGTGRPAEGAAELKAELRRLKACEGLACRS